MKDVRLDIFIAIIGGTFVAMAIGMMIMEASK